MSTMAINFSRSASQIIGQYYNFLRLGREGYENVHCMTRKKALEIGTVIKSIGCFDVLHGGEDLPVVCYKLIDDSNRKWNLFDLSDRLMMRGWQVPSYALPADMTDIIVQRIVLRADFSSSLCDHFILDFKAAVKDLNEANTTFHGGRTEAYGFTH